MMRETTRRSFLAALAGAAAAPAAAPADLIAAYDVEASILFFGVTIFKRAGVGQSWIRWRQTGEEAEVEFAAGSIPGRARGLNRLGYFYEQGAEDEARYFGFMTTSKEESFDSARKAIETKAGDGLPYSVTEGTVRRGSQLSRTAHLQMPSNLNIEALEELVTRIRRDFAAESQCKIQQARVEMGPDTFLRTVMAGCCARVETSRDYVFNAKRYTLRMKPHQQSGRIRYEGQIRSHLTNSTTRFNLWRNGADRPELPERFEYQPKSYLRLAFIRRTETTGIKSYSGMRS